MFGKRFWRRSRAEREHWRTYERERMMALGDAVFESYPTGAGNITLADTLQESRALYAVNAAVLHPLGLALGVSRPKEGVAVDGLVLRATDDPEGYTFEELDHMASLSVMEDAVLARIAVASGEFHARLVNEVKRREREREHSQRRPL